MSADASTLPDGPMNLRLRRISPGLALRHALLVARRNLLQVRGNPQLVIFVLIQPILFVLLFVYVFGGAIAGSSRQYVQFVIPGIIVQTVVFVTAVTGIGLNEDLAKGIIDLSDPCPSPSRRSWPARILVTPSASPPPSWRSWASACCSASGSPPAPWPPWPGSC